VRAIDLEALWALLYVALISTLAGFAVWGSLLKTYGASTVAPFTMLVPFFGMASAAGFLGERIHAVDVAGGVLVVGGILLGLTRFRAAPSRLVRLEA
jgi:O-acetylserine/cysteine efflux transporter